MSVSEMYQNMMAALLEKIESMTQVYGVTPAVRVDGTPFIPVDSIGLEIHGRPILFINQHVALDDDGHEYSLNCFETNGSLRELIEGLERLEDDISDAD